MMDPLCFRYGSIIAGALQSSLFGKRDKTGQTKDGPRKNKNQRGSFSFQGGMQVLNHCANISPSSKPRPVLD
jgi:type IV secretory pathway VirB10-like protein